MMFLQRNFCAFLMKKQKLSGIKMSYDRYGSLNDTCTKPLIIGHGLFGQKRNWRSLAKTLQKKLGNQIYTIDFRNHGDSPHTSNHSYQSMATDLALFLKKLQVETGFNSFFLLGHSMGGKAMAYYALNNSNELIDKLIIEDIAPHRPSTDNLILKYISAMEKIDLSQSRRQIEDELMLTVSNDSIRHFLMMNLNQEKNNLNKFFWKVNLSALKNSIREIFDFSITGQFKKPTLFLIGENSNYISIEDCESLSKIFIDSKFSVIPNASHWLHVDQPNYFVNYVEKFLKE